MAKFNDFIANIRTAGLARNNYFEVLIPLPSKMTASAQDIETIFLYCEATQLPGVNMSTNQLRVFGEPRETPYEKLFDNITLTFYVDSNLNVKYFFDRWFNIIQDKDSRTFGYYNEYISPEITVLVLDKAATTKYAVKLYECYPKAMSQITLDQSGKDVMRLEISMNYKHWDSIQYGANAEGEVKEEIPTGYFKEFKKFQNDVTDIVGGITRDIKKATSSLPNPMQTGDNYSNDPSGTI